MKAQKLIEFLREVEICLEQAAIIYNLPILRETNVDFNLTGVVAGRAQMKNFKLFLKFNSEAIEKDWDDMVKQTIPHEIAHLVCFLDAKNGSNHDAGWKKVCQTLGGNGERCHSMALTPARKRRRFRYMLSNGKYVDISSVRHNKLQKGNMIYRFKDTGLAINKDNFWHEVI